AVRVQPRDKLRSRPRTGLRVMSSSYDPRPYGRVDRARSPCRSPPGAASRRAGGHRAPPRPTPPAAPSSPDTLLAVPSLRRAPSPEPRRNSALHSRQGEYMNSRTLLPLVLVAWLGVALSAAPARAAD